VKNQLEVVDRKLVCRIIFAGHSMGGHGAWHISTHFPDKALAVVTAAGWMRKEYYGDSNVLFEHDICTSYVDAQLKAIFESSVVESYVDLLAPNLKGIPILARIGQEDRAVPPWQQRRMMRILEEGGATVVWEEIPGKEHWWWDTEKQSDGGCINDDNMRAFFAAVLHNTSLPVVDYSMSGTKSKSRKKKLKVPSSGFLDEESEFVASLPPAPHEFDLIVMNPASQGARGGLRVLQLHRPFAQGRISVKLANDTWILKTRNIRRFAFEKSAATPHRLHFFQRDVLVDGILFSASDPHESVEALVSSSQHLCSDPLSNSKWRRCREDEMLSKPAAQLFPAEKGPDTYGPARLVAESPFFFVVGGQKEECEASKGADGNCSRQPSLSHLMLSGAVYLANLHHSAADANPQILLDEQVTDSMRAGANLILFGSPKDNKVVRHYQQQGLLPVRFGPMAAAANLPEVPDGAFAIGKCIFQGPSVGVIFTFPLRKGLSVGDARAGALGLVIVGADEDGLRDVLSLGQPTIPPMVRPPYANMQPDFVVTGPELTWKGIGGVLASGYWGNSWEFLPESSYSIDPCA